MAIQTYTLVIDEDQRALLIKALDTATLLPAETELAQEFADMLQQLPEIEASDPGIVHGLCY